MQDAEVVEQAFDEALGKIEEVNEDLAAILQKKYDDDRKDFSEAAQEFCPSQEPGHWAKKSCKKCYGRGIIGTKHRFVPGQPALSKIDSVSGHKSYLNSQSCTDISCKCTQKNYQKWLVEFRLFYNALKAQTEEGTANGYTAEETTSDIEPQEQQEAL